MASKVTNRGKEEILKLAFQAGAVAGTNFNVEILTGSVPANPEDLDNYSEVSSDVVAGKTAAVARSASGFNVVSHTDSSTDKAWIQIADLDFAGAITNATGAVLTDQNGTANSRYIFAYWDFGGTKSVSAGQTLTLQDLEINLTDS